MTYKLCKKLITAGRITGMYDKLDVFFAVGRITADEYTELTGLLPNVTLDPMPADLN